MYEYIPSFECLFRIDKEEKSANAFDGTKFSQFKFNSNRKMNQQNNLTEE